MGIINGRGVMEIEADLAPVRAALPGAEAALAEAEAKVAPAFDLWMAKRAVGYCSSSTSTSRTSTPSSVCSRR